MSVGVDFDLARYIAMRHGQGVAGARDGATYAYTGERKLRRTLAMARPVTMALEATTRLWKDVARAELLGTSIKVTDQQYPRVLAAARRAGEALRLRLPPVVVAPARKGLTARVLGTEDTPYLVVGAEWADRLDDAELTALVGHELGHLHNGHVLYTTALYYLTHSAVFFVRWIVQPAIMTLQAWSRRAEITCDRAGLIAAGDVRTALSSMVKVGLGLERGAQFNLDEYLATPPGDKAGLGRFAEVFRGQPYLPKRTTALRWFADGALYAALSGGDPAGKPATADVDKRVADLISVF